MKILIKERGSSELNAIFNGEPGNIFYTTDYCKYEVFNVLKRKLKAQKSIDAISLREYFRNIRILSNYVRIGKITIDDADHDSGLIYIKTVALAEKYDLDYIDAIQFVLLQEGALNIFRGGESEAILVTSDGDMIGAAKGEKMPFWNPEDGDFII